MLERVGSCKRKIVVMELIMVSASHERVPEGPVNCLDRAQASCTRQ